MRPDCSGYATRYNVKCSDGRTILTDAFKHQDKAQVPLVWNHRGTESPEQILGHAVLQHRKDGVYAELYFNETEAAVAAKKLVLHKDISSLSILANKLVESAKQVKHGVIREVSLVLAGANPGAFIDAYTFAHADGSVDEVIIYFGEDLQLQHEDGGSVEHEDGASTQDGSTTSDKSLKELYDALTDEQKDLVSGLVGMALSEASTEHSDNNNETIVHDSEEDDSMARNVFEKNEDRVGGTKRPTLTHDQLETIVATAKKIGSFKEAFLMHAVDYGIENIELLFPDAKSISNAPELISRRQEWVKTVIGGAYKSPFSRIKSRHADITHEEARAKGYVKGNLKKEEWFSLTQRKTGPTTVYKKQKLDRDDIIDITDLDVVAWLKGEMRLMLDEELARAALVGDGREIDDEDKIAEPLGNVNGDGIRSIANDDDFYAHHVTVPASAVPEQIEEAIVRSRKYYRGAGNPTMFCTEDLLSELLLRKDRLGRRIHDNVDSLKSALRVSDIVEVPVMEGALIKGGELLVILVNMTDYTFGADKGGALAMFDDFDIDYNQYKYLMETRVSGSLTKFKTALVFSRAGGVVVDMIYDPMFDPETNIVTITATPGVTFRNVETLATIPAGDMAPLTPGQSIGIEAVADPGRYIAHYLDSDWEFTYTNPI